ncbi:MAG: argininosuccinate lyase [Gemmatimonadota bacterium]|nr:argininosuccinate lyase [Gemmatimonadota bacterium]
MNKEVPPSPDGTPASHQMWGGRFGVGPSEALKALNDSLPVDNRLWRQDVLGGKAWVKALAEAGVLSKQEEQDLTEGLDRVMDRLAKGEAHGASDEDIHSLVERLLYEEAGQVAGKLHTGRSRNDQVSTDLRLWCMEAIDAVDLELVAILKVLTEQARAGIDMIMPGYTHGQQAQAVRWGFVLLAHAWPLVRDRERLQEARKRVSVLPLGSGAVAGSGVPVNRNLLKDELGFSAVTQNALDATGDRDFVADILFALSMIGMHLSKLGQEMFTYSSTEYGFIKLGEEFSTGSSLMPQKRNPDVFELARAKAARVSGNLGTLLSVLKALPAGYNKDLQEDKSLLFDAVDTIMVTLPALRGAVATSSPVPERMAQALKSGLLATDVADELVAEGIPFREAHGIVGALVKSAEAEGVEIQQVDARKAEAIHELLPRVLQRLGSFEESTERRKVIGGTSRAAVESQIAELEALL